MRKYISDRHLVVILFVLVFVTFSFAQQDSKQLEQLHQVSKILPTAEKTTAITNKNSSLQNVDGIYPRFTSFTH